MINDRMIEDIYLEIKDLQKHIESLQNKKTSSSEIESKINILYFRIARLKKLIDGNNNRIP